MENIYCIFERDFFFPFEREYHTFLLSLALLRVVDLRWS
jgi:hypothetical protein